MSKRPVEERHGHGVSGVTHSDGKKPRNAIDDSDTSGGKIHKDRVDTRSEFVRVF